MCAEVRKQHWVSNCQLFETKSLCCSPPCTTGWLTCDLPGILLLPHSSFTTETTRWQIPNYCTHLLCGFWGFKVRSICVTSTLDTKPSPSHIKNSVLDEDLHFDRETMAFARSGGKFGYSLTQSSIL